APGDDERGGRLMVAAVVRTTTPDDEKDVWRTPASLFARAARRYGPFVLDAAAEAHNALCARWLVPGSPPAEDALTGPWGEGGARVWCNPPYSLAGLFVAKAEAEAR